MGWVGGLELKKKTKNKKVNTHIIQTTADPYYPISELGVGNEFGVGDCEGWGPNLGVGDCEAGFGGWGLGVRGFGLGTAMSEALHSLFVQGWLLRRAKLW